MSAELIVAEIVAMLVLIVANRLLAMAEMSVVSSRNARLQKRTDEGDTKAHSAKHPGTDCSPDVRAHDEIDKTSVSSGAYFECVDRISYVSHWEKSKRTAADNGSREPELVRRILDLDHTVKVSALMTPRRELVWLDANAPAGALLKRVQA